MCRFVNFLIFARKINGPFLVVVPLSTIQNWLNEVKRFCPMLRTLLLHGARADRKVMVNQLRTNGRQNWDVCVTTYEMCKVEIHALRRVPWQYFVLDEGHKAKNEKSGISRSLRSIQCKHRLMLTGTPLHVSKGSMVASKCSNVISICRIICTSCGHC